MLDFETNPVLDVAVLVNDSALGNAAEDSAELVLNVTDANEPPSVSLTNTATTFSESTNTTVRIKVADIVISDDALGSNTLILSGPDAGLFELDGSQLFIKAGTVLDFETNPVLDFTVSVTDSTSGSTPDSSVSATIDVTDANELPSVSLTNTTTTTSKDRQAL